MKHWLRRLLYLLVFLVWLIIMLFPIGAVKLAIDQEFQLGNTRVFLLQERRSGGVGFQTVRPVANETTCEQIRVRYIMWEGEAEGTSSCFCNDGIERVPDGRSCREP